ncbi:MAG: PspC domain-containing protein [Ginsengibacter sp.]
MKKVININFQGTIIPIEESSYELLKQYIESLRRYFSHEEGSNEIVNDIESRISELFNQRLKAGSTCITDEDVHDIIKNIGRPEDLEENELSGDAESSSSERKEKMNEGSSFNFNNYRNKTLYRDENNKVLGGVCSGIAAYFNIDPVIVRVLFVVFAFTGFGFLLYLILWIFVPGSIGLQNGVRKRLFRNADDKILGGVCSGAGSYFNLNPWIFRIIFLLPLFSIFGGWPFGIFSFGWGALFVYIILWLVIPEANTISEKLEMKGEKVDIHSIKNSVLKEMKDVGERVGKMGTEAGHFAAEKGSQIGSDIHQASMRTGSKAGDIIVTLFKIVLYFILGCIALAFIILLLTGAVAAVGIFPLKNFVLNDGWQSVYAWGTLIFFVAVPVIGIITLIIRRIARIKRKNNFMAWSFSGMWVIGWVFLMLLLSSVTLDFKSISSMNEVPVAIENPAVPFLLVKPVQNEIYRRNSWFKLSPFSTYSLGADTVLVGNVKLRIKKSLTENFQVSVMKLANGSTRHDADTLAAIIPFSIIQQDSVLLLDKAITINKTDKFRNQQVEVTIYVQVGHRIKIDPSFRYRNRIQIGGFSRNKSWYDYQDDRDYDYRYGVEYIMKSDGLYTLSGKSSNDKNSKADDDEWNTEEGNSYRYHNFDSLKTEQQNQLDKMQRSMDSVKDAQRKETERLKDSLRKVKEDIDKKIEKLNTASYSGYNATDDSIIHVNTFMMNI